MVTIDPLDLEAAQNRDEAMELLLRQDELEAQLLAAASASWREAAEKARYLLNLFAGSTAGQDPRRQKLIAAVLDDFRE